MRNEMRFSKKKEKRERERNIERRWIRRGNGTDRVPSLCGMPRSHTSETNNKPGNVIAVITWKYPGESIRIHNKRNVLSWHFRNDCIHNIFGARWSPLIGGDSPTVVSDERIKCDTRVRTGWIYSNLFIDIMEQHIHKQKFNFLFISGSLSECD